MELNYKYFAEVDSTNTRLKEAAGQGAPEGTVYSAGRQTAGRGRSGHGWESPEGESVATSLLLYPEGLSTEEMALLTPLAAVAVCDAIEELYDLPTQIKWVNDVLINEKKVSGILTEQLLLEEGRRAVVVGIGVNVDQKVFPAEISGMATSICMEMEKAAGTTAGSVVMESAGTTAGRAVMESTGTTAGRSVMESTGTMDEKGSAEAAGDAEERTVREGIGNADEKGSAEAAGDTEEKTVGAASEAADQCQPRKQPDKKELSERIWQGFLHYYEMFMRKRTLGFIRGKYNAKLVNRGRRCVVLDPRGAYEGEAIGIDAEGRLCIRLDDGSERSVDSGEVSVRGIYGYV